MKTVVITQPMYFPWVGLFEQVQLADTLVFLDNVQFARGFINRVQCKSESGSKWLTVPLQKHSQSTLICDLQTFEEGDWRLQHLNTLRTTLRHAPFRDDALAIAEKILNDRQLTFSQMLVAGVSAVCSYFKLAANCQCALASQVATEGKKSDLIKDLVQHFQGTHYVTGLGALNYLDHEGFEASGIQVRYMDYQKVPYPQLHGPFTPYVTILDLIANCGVEGARFISSGTVDWRALRHQKQI